MPDLGCYAIKSHGSKLARTHRLDWFILLVLVAIDMLLDSIESFHRFVGKDMMADLKYPYNKKPYPFGLFKYVFAWLLRLQSCLLTTASQSNILNFLHFFGTGILYSALITAVITDSVKVAVGRPHPSFFWRCFPDGKAVFDNVTNDVVCYGDKKVVEEGYKSFPSGHTACLGFFSWYLSGNIRACNRGGHIAKLCLVLLPLLLAAFVGISRVDDYRHHWQDVFAGGLIGLWLRCIKIQWLLKSVFIKFIHINSADSGFL